jgi:hypothetical protein
MIKCGKHQVPMSPPWTSMGCPKSQRSHRLVWTTLSHADFVAMPNRGMPNSRPCFPQRASPSPPFALHELAESHHSNSLNHRPSNPQVYEVPLGKRDDSLLAANAEAGLRRIDVVADCHAPARRFVAGQSSEWCLHRNDERTIRGASQKGNG